MVVAPAPPPSAVGTADTTVEATPPAPVVDAGSSARLPSGPGNPPFYEVMGQRYHVRPDNHDYSEQGVASWYGRKFHGRQTSNGEIYDMYAMTAAHKTLPLPTNARVTNLATGKSIVVRINDRGPFVKDRLIDLSFGAARELGFVEAGTAMVEVVALGADGLPAVAANTESNSASQTLMYAQVGAFSEQGNAERLRRQLEQNGISKVLIHRSTSSATAPYRVRIGPVADAREFDSVAATIGRMQLGEPRLVVEAGDLPEG